MLAAETLVTAPARSTENGRPTLRLCRPGNAAAALGLAVAHLMTRPAFARLEFGAWSRVLVGQVNRRHYHLVLDRNRVVGFLGWALTSEANAEAWLGGRSRFDDAEATGGDCVVFNIWSADTRAVNRFVLEAARRVARGKRRVYGKRCYENGTVRPVAVNVNAFVAGHLPHAA